MVADLVQADLLLILTDIEGLYTADPRLDPTAEFIAEIHALRQPLKRWGSAAITASRVAACSPSSRRPRSWLRAASQLFMRMGFGGDQSRRYWPVKRWARSAS